MNAIEQLSKYLKQTHPEVDIRTTPPLRPTGVWSLDIDSGLIRIAVEWQDGAQFGISSVNNDSYGECPDETYRNFVDACRRLDQLLTSNERTAPPLGILLSRLRESRKMTQSEVATKLNIRQASVSGYERREDIQLSTLSRIIHALGGALDVSASFPDAKYRLLPFGEPRSEVAECSEQEATDGETNFEQMFTALHASGKLARARKEAQHVSHQHVVTEIP
jgi:transcriptional regulator with XRE-family HTH domain